MSELKNILERLANELDADYDIAKALGIIAESLNVNGATSRKEFTANNGFAVVMQFHNASYVSYCAKVLLAWLMGDESQTWPSWVFRRIVEISLSTESSHFLRKMSLKLLVDGVEKNASTKKALFSKDDSNSAPFQFILNSIQTSQVSDLHVDELKLILHLIKLYAKDRDYNSCFRILCILLSAMECMNISNIQSQQLIQIRFSQNGQVHSQNEERNLLCYTQLIRSFRSLFAEMESGDLNSEHFSLNLNQEFISRIVKETRAVHSSSPTKLSRVLDWNCKLKGFEARQFALKDSDEGQSILELWLDFIQSIIKNKQIGKWFYRSNLTSLMDSLCGYDDNNILEKLVILYSRLASFSMAASKEILEDKNIVGIAGLIHSNDHSLHLKGIECLLSKVDMMSGNEYSWFTNSPRGLTKMLKIFTLESNGESNDAFMSSIKTVVQAALDRSRRIDGMSAPHLPQSLPWKSIHNELLHSIDTSPNKTTSSNNKTISKQALPETRRREQNEGAKNEDLYDEDGLRVVFDSGPSESIRKHREDWKALTLNSKVRWTQTTTDVLVWIRVPKGTKVKQLAVLIEPERLTVRLDWHGRVIDGPLHRRCKSTEAIWVLEDDEVHIMLPKDDSHYWKSLFEGGTEKSFMEIIQESVESDETMPSYDQLDMRSKELIEDIQERQQMVHDGLIDLEGFDDFRIVVGENSL